MEMLTIYQFPSYVPLMLLGQTSQRKVDVSGGARAFDRDLEDLSRFWNFCHGHVSVQPWDNFHTLGLSDEDFAPRTISSPTVSLGLEAVFPVGIVQGGALTENLVLVLKR